MGKVQKLTDDQVRHVKVLLMEGHTVANVARMYQQSADTISRIKRGVSRQSVVVEGEAVLRPANAIWEAPVEGAAQPRGMGKMLDDAADATLERLLEAQRALDAGEEPRDAASWNGGVGKYEEVMDKFRAETGQAGLHPRVAQEQEEIAAEARRVLEAAQKEAK